MDIGKIIKSERVKQNMTLRDLSEKTGISVSFISDVENGRRNLSTEKAVKISKALNINPAAILSNELIEMIDNKNKSTDPKVLVLQRAGEELSEDELNDILAYAKYKYPNKFKDEKNEK